MSPYLLLSLIFFTEEVASQNPASSNCKGATIVQYFGNDRPQMESVALSERGPAGPPGKAGPFGPMGPKGEMGELGIKGNKGEPGQSPNAEILKLRAELESLKSAANNPPRSCDSVAGATGYHLISPSGREDRPFYAYCETANVSTANGSWAMVTQTLIDHDSEEEIQMDDCEEPRCYKRMVTYSVSMRQIIQLIDASLHCRQFIKFRCQGSVLHWKQDKPRGAWLSRNGTLKLNWGGSERDNYCACGEAGTCVDSQKKCNCDVNSDSYVTSDEGYLTNKDDLPVSEMHFGDAGGASEFGWHTLGKLECWGRV